MGKRRQPLGRHGHGRRAPRARRASGGSGTWWSAFSVCVLVGMLCALFALGWQLAVATGAAFILIGTSVVACAFVDRGLSCLPICCEYGTIAGTVATSALGVLIVSPGLGVLLIFGLVATHPFVRAWLSALVGTTPEGTGREATHGSTVDALADDALCRAWLTSFVALQRATSATARAEVVTARQKYLDELTRRHPAAMSAWLGSGAAPSGNHLPFLDSPTTPEPRDPGSTL